MTILKDARKTVPLMIIRECFSMRQKPSVHRWELRMKNHIEYLCTNGDFWHQGNKEGVVEDVGSMGFCLKIAIRAITYVTKSSTDVHWFLDALYDPPTWNLHRVYSALLYPVLTSFVPRCDSFHISSWWWLQIFLCLWIDIKKVESQPFTGTDWWVKLSKYQEY